MNSIANYEPIPRNGGVRDVVSTLTTRDCWWVIAVIFLWKIGYMIWVGPIYDPDTWGYLTKEVVPQPALYTWFLKGLNGIWQNIYFICVVQISLFSITLGWLLCRLLDAGRWRYVAAALCAIDPYTSNMCATLLSEALFLSFLFLSLLFTFEYLKRPDCLAFLILFGVFSTLAYLTRYIGAVLPLFFVCAMVLNARSRPRLIVHVTVLLLISQLVMLPVRVWHKRLHNTASLDMGNLATNLWCCASFLYPESRVRTHPSTDFERFLAGRGTEEFTLENTLDCYPFSHPEFALRQYLEANQVTSEEELNKKEWVALSNSITVTAFKIIKDQPFRYMFEFIPRSFARSFTHEEYFDYDGELQFIREYMIEHYNYDRHVVVDDNRYYWAVYFSLFVMTLFAQVLTRMPQYHISLFILIYLGSIAVVIPFFLRYVMVLAPLIVLNAVMTVRHWHVRAAAVPAGNTH